MPSAVKRKKTAATTSLPAPVGGLNARDALNGMPITDASVMTNMFPYADRVATRAGYSTLSTATVVSPGVGLSARDGFRNLMYRSTGGAGTLLAGWLWSEEVGGALYKKFRVYSVNLSLGTLTSSTEVVTTGGTEEITELGEWTQFTSGAGVTYLLLVTTLTTGATITLKAFDGTSWTTPTTTGVPTNTPGIHSHRNRLWFYGNTAANEGLAAYYLPVGAISGTVTKFNLGPFASKGGRIISMRTWTLDGGTGGADDLAVFLTDRGQAIVYEGSDPSALATWRLVGVFDLGLPATTYANSLWVGSAYEIPSQFLRDSSAMKYGADLLFLLNDGLNSAARALRPSTVENGDYTITSKIRPLITDLALTNGAFTEDGDNHFCWKMAHFAGRRQLLIAIPTSIASSAAGTRVEQTTVTGCTVFAMNTETGAWTKFTGMNILDMLPIGNSLYFIDGSQKIYKYGAAADDSGTAITWECRQAYTNFGSADNKLLTLMQPMLRAPGNFSMTAKADVDFNGETISTYTSYTVAAESNVMPWVSPAKLGRFAATHLKGQTSAGVVSWYATNWAAKQGGLV